MQRRVNIVFWNSLLFFYFLVWELQIGFGESSKLIIADQLSTNRLHQNSFLVGFLFQKLNTIFMSILNTFEIKYSTSQQHVFIHFMFLSSSILWMIFFNIFYHKNRSSLSLVVISCLCLNPFFIDFIHFSWRQSLALCIFLIFFSLNFRTIFYYLGCVISVAVHFGILPTALLAVLFRSLKTKLQIHSAIVALLILGIFSNTVFPFSPSWIPDFIPYQERLTLSFNNSTPQYLKINNFEGEFIFRYFLIGFLVILFVQISTVFEKLKDEYQAKLYTIILASSFPLLIFASAPTANRLSYFFLIISMIYGPSILKRKIGYITKGGVRDHITIFSVVLGHIIIFVYFNIG